MSTEKRTNPRATEQVEEIVTCACSHQLAEHTNDGCAVEDCECEVERGLLLVGKVQAIDQG